MSTGQQNNALESKSSNVTKVGFWWSAAVVAAAGIGASIYAISHHLQLKAAGQTNASCNINSTISCDAVASSPYSEIFGYPLGVFGAGYFLAMLVMAVTVAKGHKTKREHEPTWFLLAGLGVLSSIILGVISVGVIGKVCLVCFAVYGITALQAGIAFMLYQRTGMGSMTTQTVSGGLTSAAVMLALAVVGFNVLKPTAELPLEMQDTAGKHDQLQLPKQLSPTTVEIPLNRTPYSGLGEDYRLGSDEAKVVITEFADYQCPGCADAKRLLDELHMALGDKVLIVFKNFPLSNRCNSAIQSDMHPYSCDIARLARCSGQYGKFWEFHRLAFDEQKKASTEQAKVWAKSVGLTAPQIEACLASQDILAKIRDDVELANRIGVDSTPTIFINGRKYVGGRTLSELRSAVESF